MCAHIRTHKHMHGHKYTHMPINAHAHARNTLAHTCMAPPHARPVTRIFMHKQKCVTLCTHIHYLLCVDTINMQMQMHIEFTKRWHLALALADVNDLR